MKRINITLLLLILVITAAASATSPPITAEELVTVVLPVGDPAAGRKAFIDLRCYACHSVAGETQMTKPFSANQGPVLTRTQVDQSSGKLATSIISPSHVVSKEVAKKSGGRLSPMGDFSEAMTVRQLLDLLAYLAPFEMKE